MTELDARDMLGRPVKIKPGVVKSSNENRIGGSPKASPFSIDRWRRNETPTFAQMNSDSSRRLYVSGLPRLTDHEALSININNFFQDFQVYVFFPPSSSGEEGNEVMVVSCHTVKALASCLPLTLLNSSKPVTITTSLSTLAASKRPKLP